MNRSKVKMEKSPAPPAPSPWGFDYYTENTITQKVAERQKGRFNSLHRPSLNYKINNTKIKLRPQFNFGYNVETGHTKDDVYDVIFEVVQSDLFKVTGNSVYLQFRYWIPMSYDTRYTEQLGVLSTLFGIPIPLTNALTLDLTTNPRYYLNTVRAGGYFDEEGNAVLKRKEGNRIYRLRNTVGFTYKFNDSWDVYQESLFDYLAFYDEPAFEIDAKETFDLTLKYQLNWQATKSFSIGLAVMQTYAMLGDDEFVFLNDDEVKYELTTFIPF